MNEINIEKKIKKNIYGKAQTAKVIFPPGLSEIALHEVQSILNNSWFPQKFSAQCLISKNEIHIRQIHFLTLIEILMRSQCLSDIRLVIFQGKTFDKYIFQKQCQTVDWALFINKKMSIKIKVKSIASHAFHETGLKEILSDILKEYAKEIVSGENTLETTTVYADLYKNKLVLSISLAGSPLYKRGYRTELSDSAPLREDFAISCIGKAIEFAKINNPNYFPERVFIPFSGTGTFAFEFLQWFFHYSPILLGRKYALEEMPLFRMESFNYLLKKAKETCLFNSSKNKLSILCVDTSEKANMALAKNLQNFKQAIMNSGFSLPNQDLIEIKSINFIEISIKDLNFSEKNIFLPLNPPYGIRLGNHSDSINLYKNIAKKINDMVELFRQSHFAGFILCPSEETWLSFSKYLKCSASQTYHFTQGGMDIRVCQFYC